VEDAIDKRKDMDAITKIIEDHPELPIMEEVRRIREWLLADYKAKLSDAQLAALEQAISDRVRNFISAERFREVLDLSKKQFGVGLSFRASHKLTEKLEAIFGSNKMNYAS